MPKTTSAQGSGTRGSRRSRGSRSGFVIIGPSSASSEGPAPLKGPTTSGLAVGNRGAVPLLLVLELGADRLGEVVPRVDELLHSLVPQDAEHVVQVHAGVGDGLHGRGRLVVGLLHGRARCAVVGV